MNKLFLVLLGLFFLVGTIMFPYNTLQAQNWLQLRETGANYNEVKAAFLKQYGSKLSKFRKEARKEARIGIKHHGDGFEQEMEGIVQFMRWSHDVEPRVAEFNGDVKAMGEAHENAIKQLKNKTQTRGAGSWTLIGPTSTPNGGGNGRVNAVRAMPGNNNILFACTPSGGLWKSLNAGVSWSSLSDAIPVIGATDIAIDPTNTNIMYLATGDGDNRDANSIGVYKTIDGGITWAPTSLTFTVSSYTRISRILIDPVSLKLFVGSSAGIYTSINGGASWVKTSSVDTKDLEFNPANTSTIYAGCYSGNVFLRSYDAGATWTSNIVSGTGNGLPTSAVQRVAVATTPIDSNYVYCLIAETGDYGFKGLYRSIDGGSNFTLQSSATIPSATTPNILGFNVNGDDAGGQGWYTLSLAVDPTNKNTIYTGGVNIWKNTNAGATGSWSLNAHWYGGGGKPYVHADTHDLFFVGNTLYAANDGGVFSTSNGGSTWSDNSSNLSNAEIYSIGLSASNPNLIISGHQDNGTNLTTNQSTWKEVNGGDGFVCFMDRTSDLNAYSSIYYGQLYKSTDGGSNFNNIYNVDSAGWVTPWLQDPNTPTTIYAAGRQIAKSTNSGSSWAKVTGFANSIGTLVSLDVAQSNSNYMVTASKNTILSTTDGGASWIKYLTPSNVLKVYFDLNIPTTIYACLASYSGNSVYMSVNSGATWASISTGLPSIPTETIVQQNNGDLYCGTDVGVYFRPVNATSWTSVTTGMPGVRIFDLKIYAPTNKLRAATYGRGIWEMDLKNVGLTLNAKVFLQGPFNSTTGLMIDSLRKLASFPLTSPYGTNETINASVLNVSGNNSIVDWVKIELRDKNTPATVLQTHSALLQSDGDIVEIDGITPVFFSGVSADNYYVTVKHRNHLSVTTASAQTFSNGVNTNLNYTNAQTYGTNALKSVNGTLCMWAGDANGDGQIKYTNANNDRAALLSRLNSVLTGVVLGYYNEDVNMDGVVKYTNANNDRSVILSNLNSVLTAVIVAQTP